MSRSMTGYGKSDCVFNTNQYTVEIRSVNSKSLDLNIKIPAVYREKEADLRNRLNQVVQRGKVDVFMMMTEAQNGRVACEINKGIFEAHIAQLEELMSAMGVAMDRADLVPCVLRLPDILRQPFDELDEAEWNAVFNCFNKALEAFDAFRREEGQMIMQDILQRIATIGTLLSQVDIYEPQRIETVKQRIMAGLEAISIAGYDQNRFEQELIYYIEKFDITEEKVRLKQHCTYFTESSKAEEAPGRKLGFIAQEIGREINTMGSKANHVEIQKIVVAMKDELEKVKEQLLNVL